MHRLHRLHRRLRTVVLAGLAALTVSSTPAVAAVAATPTTTRPIPSTVAPGAPGAESFFDLARKDCVGTARNRTSKIWFTVADGVLSDVYEPTVDTTNVKTMQYIVTDGHTWTDLQERDMTYVVSSDPTGMSCTVTASSASHGYKLTTTYVADPRRDAVVLHTAYHGPAGLAIYVRLEPLVGGNGGGGSVNGGADSAVLDGSSGTTVPVAYDTNTVTNAVNRSYAAPTYEALEQQAAGFAEVSVGYAGTASDGLSLLDTNHALTDYQTAPGGHVALTSRVALDSNGEVTMALGFGRSQTQAVGIAGLAAATPFSHTLARYLYDWLAYDSTLKAPQSFLASGLRTEYYKSVNVVKASEDKTFPGAIAAGLASPWGQAVSAAQTPNGLPVYFGSYREVFARDLYEAFTGLLVAGDIPTAQAAARFLLERQQQPDGSMPRNSLLNGLPAPDTGGLQLDETSYPILMAWQSGLGRDSALWRHHIQPAADFLVAHGPSDGVERWEEQSGYSPSTIAAEIAGLTAASAIARGNGDTIHARVYQATADDFARNIKGWTVTTTGPYGNGSYFLRLSKTGDPNAAINVNLGNGGPTVDQRAIIDGGFQELVRLGILPGNDPTVAASVAVADKVIRRTTPSGPGFYRYDASSTQSDDGYGDCYQPSGTSCSVVGAPWPPTGVGTGHLWPVLSGERAEYDLSVGNSGEAGVLLESMANMTSGIGLMPEQAWEYPALPASPYGSDPATASIGFRPGRPAGSASPLTWAQAQFARLVLDLGAGRALERPGVVADRYGQGLPGPVPLAITSPTNGQFVSGATVVVTGTTAPHAAVSVEADNALSPSSGAVASTTSDTSGNFRVTVPIGFGSTTLTVAATLGTSTGYAQVSVNNTALPGTTLLKRSDPAGDDNGPGNYAYPTAPDFKPGAFDLTGMQINETSDTVYVQIGVRNLEATFGNAIGAQLFDLYVHNPAASSTSTDAAYATRNYDIAGPSAWSERIEVQGFAAPVWVDANGNALGAVHVVPVENPDTSGTVTLLIPRAAFGSPTSGWSFVLTLTGQDGFSGDQARGFTPTPGQFTFGVCAAVSTDPHCTFDPNLVPKVIDTLTPTGIAQSTELDYTLGRVVLHGVPIP